MGKIRKNSISSTYFPRGSVSDRNRLTTSHLLPKPEKEQLSSLCLTATVTQTIIVYSACTICFHPAYRTMFHATKSAMSNVVKRQAGAFRSRSASSVSSLKGQHFISIDQLRFVSHDSYKHSRCHMRPILQNLSMLIYVLINALTDINTHGFSIFFLSLSQH